MSIAINNNSYDYSINLKGRELENENSIDNSAEVKSAQKIEQTGKVECQTCKDRKYLDVSNESAKSDNNEKKDYFITNYNDIIAKNFGLILDIRV